MRFISRNRSLALALAIIGILVFGCSSQPAAPSSTAVPTKAPAAAPATTAAPATSAAPATTAAATSAAPAAPTGELRFSIGAMGSEVFDPKDMTMFSYYALLMYDFLVGVTPDAKLSKDTGLASDWTTSADGLTWTFTIRKGVKFQNGDDLTAEDAAYSIGRVIGPKGGSGYAGLLRSFVESASAPNATTLVVKLKSAFPTLPYVLSQTMGSAEGAIVQKKYTESVGSDNFNAKPMGSGPYRFVSAQPNTDVKLEAMPTHWRVGVPKYKNVTFRIIAEPTTLIASLKRGESDVIGVPVASLKELAGYNVAVKKDANAIGLFILQQWEDVPYRDLRVREAMSLAIDRKAINDTLLGGTGTANPVGALGGNVSLGYPSLPELTYNPDRAKQLMKDAGVSGFDMTIYMVPRPGGYDLAKMDDMVAEYWRAIGIRATVKPTDYATLRAQQAAKKLPSSMWIATSPNIPLNDGSISAIFGSEGFMTTTKDTGFDNLLAAWRKATTLDEYAKGQGAALKYLRDNLMQVGLLHAGEYYSTSAALKGWNPGSVPGYFDLDALVKQK